MAKGGLRKRSEKTAHQVEMMQRQDEALRLRMVGTPYRSIGKALGISYQQASDDIRAAIERRGKESSDELRAMATRSLEAIITAHLGLGARTNKPSTWSADVAIRAIATHAKLNGYEAPAKIDLKGQMGAMIVQVTPEVAAAFAPPTEELPAVLEETTRGLGEPH